MPGLSRSGQNKSAIGNKINRFDFKKISPILCFSVFWESILVLGILWDVESSSACIKPLMLWQIGQDCKNSAWWVDMRAKTVTIAITNQYRCEMH